MSFVGKFLINIGLHLSGKLIAAKRELAQEVKDLGYATWDEDKAYRYTLFKDVDSFSNSFVTITHVASGRRKEVKL